MCIMSGDEVARYFPLAQGRHARWAKELVGPRNVAGWSRDVGRL